MSSHGLKAYVRPGMFDAHHFPGDLLLGDYGETPTQFGTVGRPLFGGGHAVTSSGAEFFEGFIDKDFCWYLDSWLFIILVYAIEVNALLFSFRVFKQI